MAPSNQKEQKPTVLEDLLNVKGMSFKQKILSYKGHPVVGATAYIIGEATDFKEGVRKRKARVLQMPISDVKLSSKDLYRRISQNVCGYDLTVLTQEFTTDNKYHANSPYFAKIRPENSDELRRNDEINAQTGDGDYRRIIS